MKWERVSDYCIRSGDTRICKVKVGDVLWYEVWPKGARIFAARFRTAAEAKAYAGDTHAKKPQAPA